MVLDRELLDCPIETADNELLKILKRHCQQISGARPKADDFVFDVMQLITTLLPSGQSKKAAVAQELGMSSRTLTRRLAKDGLTYPATQTNIRLVQAQRVLNTAPSLFGKGEAGLGMIFVECRHGFECGCRKVN